MTNVYQGRSLEETAERLRRAQKAGRLGTWDWNLLTNELLWDGVEAVHGLPDGSFGGSFEAYLADMHPEDRERVLAAIGLARETGSDLDIEYRIVLPEGSVRWVSGRGTCFQDEDGRTVRMAGTCQDITERKLSEQHKEDLFAFASHELRNPLTSILGFARLLEHRLGVLGEPLDEDGLEAVRTISSESQRMADILETFLDLARSESSQSDIDIESVSLLEFLSEEIERISVRQPDVTVHADVAEADVVIQTDARRLRQVLSNLLDNAVKYGGTPPEVWISGHLAAPWVEIRVRDNGSGISAEDRQHLFGRFYRGSASGGRRKGLGIGLYLSRQFAEWLGGNLELESPPGQSAVFLLRLPLGDARASR